MSEPYQMFVLIPDGMPAKDAIFTTHRVLEQEGGSLEDDSLLLLNDTDDVEPDPEEITDGGCALATLASWPTLGSVTYAMPEGMVTVSYKGPANSGRVEAVKMAVLPRAFERGGDESRRRYAAVARVLHDALGATRTIMDWGLEYRGFHWADEITRLRHHTFDGSYELLDLQSAPAR